MLKKEKVAIETIYDYILQFPKETQEILQALRTHIKKMRTRSYRKISYQMPTFSLKGNLVHFAAYKNHIGFYPAPSAIAAFQEELSIYKTAKGSVQFPINQDLPYDLIEEIVRFRVSENLKKK